MDGLPDEWETTYFGNLNQPHDGDFDKDGLPNLLEFAFGSSPTNPSDKFLPEVRLSGDGHVTLTWSSPEAASDLLFGVETSADLMSWTSGQTTLVESSTTNGITTTTVRDKQSEASTGPRFLRLVITSQ